MVFHLAWSALGKLTSPLVKFVEPLWAARNHRHQAPHRLAEGELVELRDRLNEMLDSITESAIEAQRAVRFSPNDPAAREAQEKAVSLSTRVGIGFRSYIYNDELASSVPAAALEARRRYREVVADEANIDYVNPGERDLRCAEIEIAAANFHTEIQNYAFKAWGVGLGRKSGKVNGRRLPV